MVTVDKNGQIVGVVDEIADRVKNGLNYLIKYCKDDKYRQSVIDIDNIVADYHDGTITRDEAIARIDKIRPY